MILLRHLFFVPTVLKVGARFTLALTVQNFETKRSLSERTVK